MDTFLDSFRHVTPVYLGDRAYVYLRRYILQEIQERHKCSVLALIGDQPISRASETAIKVEECLASRLKVINEYAERAGGTPKKCLDNLILILHTLGGELDETRRIVAALRSFCPEGLKVVVPSYAKSGGTFICLAADLVIMGEVSELGPIDPQINVGNAFISALDIADELRDCNKMTFRQCAKTGAQLGTALGQSLITI